MSLIQICALGTFSLAFLKALQLLQSRPHGIDLDGPDRGNWLFGNVASIFQGGIDYLVHIAEKYGGVVRLQGLAGEVVYISDPLAYYHVFVKDQHIFEEPDSFISSNKVMFGEGLISTIGEQHRRQRKLLNPVFSPSNIRQLFPILHPIANRLVSALAAKLPADGSHKEIDVLPWLSRCALDGVCQGILGYPSNTLSTENDAYTDALRMMGPLIGRLWVIRPFGAIVLRTCSPYWAAKIADFATAPWLPTQLMRDIRELRRIIETMDEGSRKAFTEKKAAFDSENTQDPTDDVVFESKVKDVMNIMLKANSVSSNAERLTDAELLGQMNVMVFAGLDTTTSALARCVYLLAQHPKAQARLRSEIRDAIKENAAVDAVSTELPYEVLMQLPFLDAIVKETLRLYPSLPIMGRKATKATVLPLQFPARSRNGGHTSAVAIPEGTYMVVSILAANRHRAVWGDDANEWRPERWLASPEAPSSAAPVPGVKDGVRYPSVYSNMMTFLAGSRSCIGFKFAEMEIKQVLASLMLDLHFALPTEPINARGDTKEIYWKLDAFHVPVVRPPVGDGVTPQVPLDVRVVREGDFVW